MRRSEDDTVVSRGRVGLRARRVALGATVLALIFYLLACLIADLFVLNRLNSTINLRLDARLISLTRSLPKQIGSSKVPVRSQQALSDDLDDAPILAWFVPTRAATAQRLITNEPTLPRQDWNALRTFDATISDRHFRAEGLPVTSGRIVVATSILSVTNVRNTLLIIEGALAPILLLTLFISASVIGWRAAIPIERFRLRQLEFTADASHELRTPLSVIEAEVGLALSSKRSASAYRTALERVASESKRLSSIVDDLLWLARLDSLPANPPNEPVDVSRLAQSCSDRFGNLATRDGLSISFHDSGSFPALVLAPADWLDRLLSVLLDNACRYSGAGGHVAITVTTTDERVSLAVEDDGPGIDEQDRIYITQRFHRASTVPGGAGLGLSIASAVVRSTNGDWEVGSSSLGGAKILVSWTRFRTDGEPDLPGETGDDLASTTDHLVSPR